MAVQTNAGDRKSTRLNSSHLGISYAVFCLKKKKRKISGSWKAPLSLGWSGETPCTPTGTENSGSPALKLRFPRWDLIGVDVDFFLKLSQPPNSPHFPKRPLRLD